MKYFQTSIDMFTVDYRHREQFRKHQDSEQPSLILTNLTEKKITTYDVSSGDLGVGEAANCGVGYKPVMGSQPSPLYNWILNVNAYAIKKIKKMHKFALFIK